MVSDPSDLHPSALRVVADLRERYPGVPLIALGQTVFWDEPTKAALRRILDLLEPERRLILGVHDTDYFAKAPAAYHGDRRFAILPHNDGSTHGLWAAAGEIARLFGCEVTLSRDDLRKYGVQLDKIPADNREALLDAATEAWGWRGLVRVGTRDVLALDVTLAEVLPALIEMLEWGFAGTRETLEGGGDFDAKLIRSIRDFAEANPDASLSRLYKWLLPRFYESLLGEEARNIEVACSGGIFRFTPETVSLPRFAFVDLFLRPETRRICATAYNEALIGAETYTLDRFGHGAVPFDLVVFGRGRGTVRVMPDRVIIDLPRAEEIPTDQPVESAADLARVVNAHFGSNVALVGKAVALLNMLNNEFMLVFHTYGSSYASRTRKMNERIVAEGVPLKLNPILRVGHRTWDALESVPVRFRLPEHLARAFGGKEISGPEFARRWTDVVREQGELLDSLAAITSARDLIRFLEKALPDHWGELYKQYDIARTELAEIGARSKELNARIDECYGKINELKELIDRLEASKGLYYREHIRPLQERLWDLSQQGITEGPEVGSVKEMQAKQEAVRADMGAEIAEHRATVKRLQDEINVTKKAMREAERGERAIALRKDIARIEGDAQTARLELVRSAYLTHKDLPYSNFRPSAWWFALADPTGHWFDVVTRRAELYLEEIV